jgi:hypothetical protein
MGDVMIYTRPALKQSNRLQINEKGGESDARRTEEQVWSKKALVNLVSQDPCVLIVWHV